MKVTPMLQQYLDAKARYPETIVFFRMGDFYEMFFEDAVTAARELGLTLTARNKGEEDEVPMAGFPHHSSGPYISALIERGMAVAICEQLEDPSQTKGLVKRDVVRVITPGLVMDPDSLDARTPNYVASVYGGQSGFGIASLDVSTGTFRATFVPDHLGLVAELARLGAREVISNPLASEVLEARKTKGFLRPKDEEFFESDEAEFSSGLRIERDLMMDGLFLDEKEVTKLLQPLRAQKGMDATLSASCGILRYLAQTQRGIPTHIRAVEFYEVGQYLVLDDSTRANLELTETLMGGKRVGSLLNTIDKTVSAAGGRLLRHWMNYPLVDPKPLNFRLDSVSEFVKKTVVREDLRLALDGVYDLERLCGRISSGNANARDLKALSNTISAIAPIKALLAEVESTLLVNLTTRLDTFDDLRERLEGAIVASPPVSLNEGGIFERGFSADLDELIDLTDHGKDWMLAYEAKEKERTKISSLKVRYNKVFGYYVEITRANLDMVPDDYIRKQTLANAERYFTSELKEMEDKILGAEDRRKELEYRLFERLRNEVAGQIPALLSAAQILAELDVLAAFAELALRHDYVRPEVDDGTRIVIEEGRHPVVERTLDSERFVPNSVNLDTQSSFLQIITGPNMAGKSTVIRQVALITLMAQMGSFVPAKTAHIGTVDKIFSRVGASDNLAKGQSTFMVEMTETAHILQHATARSLVILDEIGRGTSTFDGLSIAWAVAEHLHDRVRAKTMFATHYHELTELARTMEGAKNMSIAVKEWNDDIIFLRKLVEGQANRSYGIQVGRLAGLPETVVARAKQVLENLESGRLDERGVPVVARGQAPRVTPINNPNQLTLFGQRNPAEVAVIEKLGSLDINALTPLEALNALSEMKRVMEET